jgi:hypothetical protein
VVFCCQYRYERFDLPNLKQLDFHGRFAHLGAAVIRVGGLLSWSLNTLGDGFDVSLLQAGHGARAFATAVANGRHVVAFNSSRPLGRPDR